MKSIKNIKVNKKKVIILVSLVVLLVATGCLNYFLTVRNNQSQAKDPVDAATPTFFETYRTDRDATRSQEILYLEDIIVGANADETTIANAQGKKIELVGMMETELALEGLIKARGFADCVVTMSSNNVNVVVQDAELGLDEAAQILSIIVAETDYEAANVYIIPYV